MLTIILVVGYDVLILVKYVGQTINASILK